VTVFSVYDDGVVFSLTKINFCRETSPSSSSQLSCKNEDFSKSGVEKKASKPSVFQVHVDEPDGAACSKKPALHAAPTAKARPAEGSAAPLHGTMTRLRQPLAPLDIPSVMDVSFGRSTKK